MRSSVDRSKCQANIGAEAATTDISLENWDDSDREDSILLVKKKKKLFEIVYFSAKLCHFCIQNTFKIKASDIMLCFCNANDKDIRF